MQADLPINHRIILTPTAGHGIDTCNGSYRRCCDGGALTALEYPEGQNATSDCSHLDVEERRVVIVHLRAVMILMIRVGLPRLSGISGSRVAMVITVLGIVHHRKVLDEKSSSILGGAFDRAVRTLHPPVQWLATGHKKAVLLGELTICLAHATPSSPLQARAHMVTSLASWYRCLAPC